MDEREKFYNEDEHQSEEESQNQEKMRLIDALAENLLAKRDIAVEFRAASGIESIWLEDEIAFGDVLNQRNRTSMLDHATGAAPIRNNNGPARSVVEVNIIRGKCETAEGRFSDIQLPVDDKNWGLKVTPKPEIKTAMKDDTQAADLEGNPLFNDDETPMTIADVAKSDHDAIKEKMKEMETEIDDQLTECSYNGEQRKVIRASSRGGTGILKGPNVVKTVKKTWEPQGEGPQTVHVLKTEEENKPSSKYVDKWNIFPDPDVEEDIQRAAYIWERDMILPRELRALINVDGYFSDQILKIFEEQPIRNAARIGKKSNKYTIRQSTVSHGSLYEKWEYYGDLNRDDLEALEVDISHDMMSQSFSAVVVFVNDRPIKCELNTLDTGEIPYDFFPWTQIPGSPWGLGLAQMLKWWQRIIIGSFRALMDNQSDSSGANVVIGPGIYPADGKWELRGKKIWRLNDELDADVRKAFSQFQIGNNQEQIQAVIELALRFIDMETSLPAMFQGEHESAPDTLGATNIMVDANNVALRTRVKLYDDLVTRPHLTRYYNWNMQYNKNPEIKGDYKVDARGTSVLLEKDQKAQTLMQVMAAKQDPDVNLLVDWEKATKQMFTSMRLDILKSPEDLKKAKEAMAQQPAPMDPKLEIAKMKLDGDMAKAEMVNNADMAEIQAKSNSTLEDRQIRSADAAADREHERTMKQMDLQIKMMEFASREGISLEQIKAKLAGDTMKLKTQVALAGPDKKGPQVATPVVEPEGRAPDGMAYQA